MTHLRSRPCTSVKRRVLLSMAPATIAASTLGYRSAKAQSPTRVRLTLDWVPNGGQAPIYLAKYNGYFEKEGLDVSIDSGNGGTAFIQRLTSGPYDIAVGDIGALIEAAGNAPGTPPPMQAVYALYDEPLNAIFASRKSGVATAADLPGKSIGGAIFASTRKLWPLYARAAQIAPTSVNWVTVDPQLRASLLMRGDVAAIAGFRTDLPDLLNIGLKTEDLVVLSFAQQGVQIYSNSLFASRSFINEQPAAIKAFLRAINSAYKASMASPEVAIQALLKREPLLKAAPELAKLQMCLAAMATPHAKAQGGLGGIDRSRMTNQIEQFASVLALKSRPEVDVLFNASMLPDAAERRI